MKGLAPLIFALAAAESAMAQDQVSAAPAAGVDDGSEAIVITGFRRMDTPLQDEAVSSSSLDENVFRYSGSTDRIDVLRTVPGVTVLNLGGRSTIVIRGTGTAPDGDPNGAAAASYIGEVALSGLSGSRESVDISNYDIERIDVLRGPQGFSFGGGAMSGVVRTVPNPADTSEFSGRIAGAVRTVEHGDELSHELDGYINFPIIQDQLGLRVTAYSNREENPIFATRYDRQGSPATVDGGRISLRYEPTSALTIDLRYLREDRELMDLSRTDPTLGDYTTGEAVEPIQKTTDLAWITANWDVDFATATYVASYLEFDENGGYPVYWAGSTDSGDTLGYLYNTAGENITQELRFTNNDRHGFDWTIGAYYEHRESDNAGGYVLFDTTTPATTEFDFDGVDDPSLDNFTGGAYLRHEEQKALFGELGYWFNDELGITVGARYLDHSATTGSGDYIEGLPNTPPAMIDTFPGSTVGWYRLNVTWTPDNDHLYYAQFARVERPGGTNYGALDASCPAEYADLVKQFFDGDEMETWEAGLKRQFGRGTVLNASTYYSTWTNAPVYTGALCGNGINYYIDNAGTIDVYGVEVDAQIRISDTLSASMSAAYGVAELSEASDTFTGGVEGDRMPGNPDWKVSASLDYSDEFANTGLDLVASLGFSYTGGYLNGLSGDWSTFADFVTFPGLDVGPIGTLPGGATRYNDPGSGDYFLVDARIGLESGNWKATLFADNLFGSNDRVLVNYLNVTEAGNATYTLVTPRTIGFRVERSF